MTSPFSDSPRQLNEVNNKIEETRRVSAASFSSAPREETPQARRCRRGQGRLVTLTPEQGLSSTAPEEITGALMAAGLDFFFIGSNCQRRTQQAGLSQSRDGDVGNRIKKNPAPGRRRADLVVL
jgi:hypothetical protein